MHKQEVTYRQSAKYRCPICKQWVLQADYLYSRKRTPKGEWVIVESCRKCRDLIL
jgi:C4-type Zn-finger protein